MTRLEARPFDANLDSAEPLDSLPLEVPPITYEPPVQENLLRAAIVTLVRRPGRSDELALDEIIDALSQQRPLHELPRLMEPTTRHGASVVADVGPSMLPFRADVDRLVAEIRHVVGSPNAEVWWVDDDTLAEDLEVERVLIANRPVVVISTLGAVRAPGEPLDARLQWLGFANKAYDVGADVSALVPHRLRTWPHAIERSIDLTVWDDLSQVGGEHG